MTADADDTDRTHYPDCWRDRTHHACAVAQVELARADLAAAQEEAREAKVWLDIASELSTRMEAEHARRLEVQVADAAQWRGRYMAAHDVLLAMEYFIEARTQTSMEQMRAAFLAYRAAVEAGAPLGWAVAEEQQQPNAKAQRGEGAEEGQE